MRKVNRDYYTLAIRDDAQSPFHPQFGDYDRAIVEQEYEDSYTETRKGNRRIVRSDDTQAGINMAVARLNEGARP